MAQSQFQTVGRISPSRGRTERAGSGFAGIAARILLVGGLVLTGWQAWSYFMAEAPAPARTVISAEAIAAVQITLGQATLALGEFGTGGLLSDRFGFESNLSRVRRSIEALDGLATESDERQALGRAKALLDRLVQIETAHIARVDAGGGVMGTQQRAEIPTLRDDAARALGDFRTAGARRVVAAEPDSVARLLKGSAAAGAGLLSLCIGAIGLWSRIFST